ncbi:MAG: nickel pincer cofactor biosynthesis protein LarC [Nitrospinota bacterium]|nr:nickel pincer cofactor biosynthesis protein LarC [Nitrospinota bacterium]
MKTLYFDAFSGVSGDMILGALVDAGVSLDSIREELTKLNLKGYSLSAETVKRSGLKGTKVSVDIEEGEKPHPHYSHIKEIIESSLLENGVKEMAQAIFKKIGEAEAKVHGVDIEKIHFHEVGAIDAIVDIVGAAIGISLLAPDRIISSPINTGSGTVKCAHGVMPVPAPATAEMLIGIPAYSSGIDGELATPTGVAIITTLADSFSPMPSMNISNIGYGAGTKDFKGQANLLRIIIGEEADEDCPDIVSVVETNIDDMNPEIYEWVMEKLFEAKALDVFLTPIIMKKSRSATKISVIVERDKEAIISDILLKETTTFGVRSYQAKREILKRNCVEIDTSFGLVRAKVGELPGGGKKIVPEYEDCRRIAKEKGVPLRDVYEEAIRKSPEKNRLKLTEQLGRLFGKVGEYHIGSGPSDIC